MAQKPDERDGWPTKPPSPSEAVVIPDPLKKEMERLRSMLEKCRDQREGAREEWDNRTYLQQFQDNARLMNAFVSPRSDPSEVSFTSGRFRQTLLATVNQLMAYELMPEVRTFDKKNNNFREVGRVLSTVLKQCDQVSGEKEKVPLRQYEMLGQGDVFVSCRWIEKKRIKKTLKGYTKGKFDKVEIEKKLEKYFEGIDTKIIPGCNVFLASLNTYDLEDQPYYFTVEQVPYAEMREIYGEFDNWKYVNDVATNEASNGTPDFYRAWTLFQSKRGFVERIILESKEENTCQHILNGIPMFPVGFPLYFDDDEAETGYTLVQQHAQPISPVFCYGAPPARTARMLMSLTDEALRLLVAKMFKAMNPSLWNMTGKLITQRHLLAGRIVAGVDGTKIGAMPGGEGPTQSEFSVFQELQKNLDSVTLPQALRGEIQRGGVTATEVDAVLKEARRMLGMSLFAAVSLEQKLHWKKFRLAWKNWPTDQSATGETTDRNGYKARHVVRPIGENRPTPQEVMAEEEQMAKDDGSPVRISYVDWKEVKKLDTTFKIEEVSRETDTGEQDKVNFMRNLPLLQALGADPNFLQEEAANVFDFPAERAFRKTPQGQQLPQGQPQPPQQPPQQVSASAQPPQGIQPQ